MKKRQTSPIVIIATTFLTTIICAIFVKCMQENINASLMIAMGIFVYAIMLIGGLCTIHQITQNFLKQNPKHTDMYDDNEESSGLGVTFWMIWSIITVIAIIVSIAILKM